MKTIIVPTDFSPAAVNAVNYAADMALQLKADLLLFHVYQLPLAITDTPIILMSVDELREGAESKLATLKSSVLHITSDKLNIKTEARMGIMTDELEDLCQTVQPFAVVMGTTGHSMVERTIFGSNTLTVIKHISWPIICVPKGKEYGGGIRKIGLACDLRQILETTPIPVIRHFVQEFKGELHVLNVSTERKEDVATSKELRFLQTALDSLNPTYHFIEERNLEEGVNNFAETNNLDLIITIPKKHTLLDGLFKRSSTTQIVFGAHLPVMCIHE